MHASNTKLVPLLAKERNMYHLSPPFRAIRFSASTPFYVYRRDDRDEVVNLQTSLGVRPNPHRDLGKN
jgi:hypothetical protein